MEFFDVYIVEMGIKYITEALFIDETGIDINEIKNDEYKNRNQGKIYF